MRRLFVIVAAVLIGLATLWLVALGSWRGAPAGAVPRRAEASSEVPVGSSATAPSRRGSHVGGPAEPIDAADPEDDPSRSWREGFQARFAEAGERCGTPDLRLLCRGGACAALHPPLDAAYHFQRFLRRPRVIAEQLAQAAGLPPGEASCAEAARRVYAHVELVFENDGRGKGGADCRGYADPSTYADPSARGLGSLVAELCAELESAER